MLKQTTKPSLLQTRPSNPNPQHPPTRIRMSMSRLPRNFLLPNVSSRLKCPICYDVFHKPRRLFCGHSFCKPCLKELRRNHDNLDSDLHCPLCREAIDPDKVGYDLVAQAIIDRLQVACPAKGCAWKGENEFLQTHCRFECAARGKSSLGSHRTSKCSSSWNVNIISSEEEVSVKEEESQEVDVHFCERISAEEYRYQQIRPVQGNKIFLVSRGVQTTDSYPPPPPPLPEVRRRRRRRRSVQSDPERPRIRRRRRSRVKKQQEVKVEPSAPQGKITREQEMKGIEELYQKMGFDFNGSYESAERKAKPIVVDLDAPRQIMKDKW